MPLRRRRWTGTALSWGLHGGVALVATVLLAAAPDGAPAGAPEPVDVEIISADAFEAAYAEAGAQPVAAVASAPEDAPMPEVPLPSPAPPLADLELLAVPDVPPVPDPADVPAREIVAPQPSPAPETKALPQAEPTPPEKAPAAKAEEKTEPPPKPAQQKTAARTAPKVPPKKAAKAPRTAAPGRGESGKGADATSSLAAARGSQGQSGAAGSGGITASYRARVMAHLVRFKRYPEAARTRNVRGRVLVTFSLDATGRVTGASLAGSSGQGLLDAEAVAMVHRASPFPPMPPDAGQTGASFTAPIVYDMN